jgi:hypothetical protein
LAPDDVIRAISSSSLLSESIRLELLLMFLEAIFFLPPNHENSIFNLQETKPNKLLLVFID